MSHLDPKERYQKFLRFVSESEDGEWEYHPDFGESYYYMDEDDKFYTKEIFTEKQLEILNNPTEKVFKSMCKRIRSNDIYCAVDKDLLKQAIIDFIFGNPPCIDTTFVILDGWDNSPVFDSNPLSAMADRYYELLKEASKPPKKT